MPFFHRENIVFYYEEHGAGVPLVYSHGLGSNLDVVKDYLGQIPGVRLIAYENRGHGRTSAIGDPSRLTFQVMAEDMLALLDALSIPSAIIGGSSMGAGIATAFTLKNPSRVKALILTRPAWLNSPEPSNLKILQETADLVEKYGREAGQEQFKRSARLAEFEKIAPDVAKSLVAAFMERDADRIIATFRNIPASVPFHSLEELQSIKVPTLILSNKVDPIHPEEMCGVLHAAIPNSRLRELPSKSVSVEEHTRRFRECVREFIREVI